MIKNLMGVVTTPTDVLHVLPDWSILIIIYILSEICVQAFSFEYSFIIIYCYIYYNYIVSL